MFLSFVKVSRQTPYRLTIFPARHSRPKDDLLEGTSSEASESTKLKKKKEGFTSHKGGVIFSLLSFLSRKACLIILKVETMVLGPDAAENGASLYLNFCLKCCFSQLMVASFLGETHFRRISENLRSSAHVSRPPWMATFPPLWKLWADSGQAIQQRKHHVEW